MGKKLSALIIIALLVVMPLSVYADRDVSTITAYTSTQLVQRGDWKIYRVTFTATANGGHFEIHDCTAIADTTNSNVKTEGSEVTSKGGKYLDFTNKPLEGSTGLFLVVTDCNVVIEYE